MDDLGKNVDDLGANRLGGTCEPGMLADVVGRVVSRPAVGKRLREREQGIFGSTHETGQME